MNINEKIKRDMSKFYNRNLKIPYNTIILAASGNEEALFNVLKHHEPYIRKVSTITLSDDKGRQYKFYDEDVRQRVEIKLILNILKFQI